jgi:hypothetical protein
MAVTVIIIYARLEHAQKLCNILLVAVVLLLYSLGLERIRIIEL